MLKSNSQQKSPGRILVVDDDPDLLRLLSLRLTGEGYETETALNAQVGLDVIAHKRPDLLISDLQMEEMDGMTLLAEVQRRHPGLPVLMLTAHGTIPDAVKATQHGAFGFLTKPFEPDELLSQVKRALTLSGTSSNSDKWREGIVTRSRLMEDLLDQARRVAESETSILISGESGTGKEVLARAIHKASPRHDGEFIAINCGAIPEPLLESELFGHEKGSFTGATQRHEGLIKAANGGTLFLDEVGDMPLPLQVKLLRVLQERQVRPVGSVQAAAVDIRVISATHRDLEQALQTKEFREDLYYRLNVINLQIPGLSQRREDIPALASHFLELYAKRQKSPPKVYAPEAMERLVAADWPGNIRQLQNMVEQNIALSSGAVISAGLVQSAMGERGTDLPSYTQARDEFTRNYLVQLLQITHGNVTQAARLAKRNRTDFYKLLSRHQIESGDYKAD